MKNRAIVERDVVLGGMADGIGPVLGAGGEVDKILDRNWSFFFEQLAAQLARRGVEDGGRLTGGGANGGFWPRGLAGAACELDAAWAQAVIEATENSVTSASSLRMRAPLRVPANESGL